jgi:CRISPR-associated protein Cas1
VKFTVPHIAINRRDDLSTRKMILSMTPQERKRLGIGKTTLWYMKKDIADGKTRKIYSKVLEKLEAQ